MQSCVCTGVSPHAVWVSGGSYSTGILASHGHAWGRDPRRPLWVSRLSHCRHGDLRAALCPRSCRKACSTPCLLSKTARKITAWGVTQNHSDPFQSGRQHPSSSHPDSLDPWLNRDPKAECLLLLITAWASGLGAFCSGEPGASKVLFILPPF